MINLKLILSKQDIKKQNFKEENTKTLRAHELLNYLNVVLEIVNYVFLEYLKINHFSSLNPNHSLTFKN